MPLVFVGLLIGTGSALGAITVIGLRRKLAALVLIAGILAATGGSVFAQARHPICAAKQHECGKPATIASCCCGDAGTSRDAGSPAQSRIELSAFAAATAVLPNFAHALPPAVATTAVRTSPPRLCLLDLPTLFGALLI